MLAIRLQRNGRSGYAVYRIVVQEAQRHPLSGRTVFLLGAYNPHTKQTTLNKTKAQFYLDNGAKPSARAIRIFKDQGVTLPKWVKIVTKAPSAAKHPDKFRKNKLKSAASNPENPESGKEPVAEIETK
jgi:small subunit ribosomal protein S16